MKIGCTLGGAHYKFSSEMKALSSGGVEVFQVFTGKPEQYKHVPPTILAKEMGYDDVFTALAELKRLKASQQDVATNSNQECPECDFNRTANFANYCADCGSTLN